MTATTADCASDHHKGILSNFTDSICLALKLKDQFESIDDPKKRHEAICEIIESQ